MGIASPALAGFAARLFRAASARSFDAAFHVRIQPDAQPELHWRFDALCWVTRLLSLGWHYCRTPVDVSQFSFLVRPKIEYAFNGFGPQRAAASAPSSFSETYKPAYVSFNAQ